MRRAEHPLISADRAHAEADLVRERLKAQRPVTGGESARNLRARRGAVLRQEDGDGFLEAALQQVSIAFVRNQRAAGSPGTKRQMEAVDGVEKEERANTLVK